MTPYFMQIEKRMAIFKVWNKDRTKKVFININDNIQTLASLMKLLFLLSALTKLKINGSKIVLERDGTEIDEDEVLDVFGKEILILLENEEKWQPDNYISAINLDSSFDSSPALSTASTLTYISDASHNIDLPSCSNVEDPSILVVIPPDNSQNTDLLSQPTVPTDVPKLTPTTEFTWSKFDIPWDKIPNYMLQACANSKPEKANVTEIVHVIVNAMRDIKTNIPYRAFRIVGRKLADRFPKCFLDYDEDGTVLGDGMYGIVSKLHVRNSYLNRPHKQYLEHQPVPHKKIRAVANLRAGCSNWQPQPESIAINHVKTALKQISGEDPNVYVYLDKTYANQRFFFE